MGHLGSSVESSRSTCHQIKVTTVENRLLLHHRLLLLRFSSRHISTHFTYVNDPIMSLWDCSMQRYEFTQVRLSFNLFSQCSQHILNQIIYLHSIVKCSLFCFISSHATDPNHKLKLISTADVFVESCDPNPCQNGGKCIVSDKQRICQCKSHFTGRFCSLTMCELDPCVFGQCELTKSGFKVRIRRLTF